MRTTWQRATIVRLVNGSQNLISVEAGKRNNVRELRWGVKIQAWILMEIYKCSSLGGATTWVGTHSHC
jgi:hypothetical protein